jgi:hypothetical protein
LTGWSLSDTDGHPMRVTASLVLLSSLAASLAACGSSPSSASPDGDSGAGSPEAGAGSDGAAGHDGGAREGGPSGGGIGADGGTLSDLYFAVTGDTRPPSADDVSGYPTAIVTKIFQDIEALDPRPPFVVATGDYQDSSIRSSSTALQQIGLYMQARGQYSGAFFPGMGNHECTGADDSNCGPGTNYGTTPNLSAFLSDMLGPIHKTLPYYVFDVNATDGSWTSKFVVTAPNAWDTDQQTWLSSTLAEKTTYTFVIRHEPSSSSGNPAGVAAIDTLLGTYPYTLLIEGHSHEYKHPYRQEVIFGNGGAPPTTAGQSYGFGTFQRRSSDGAIVVDAVDSMTGATDPSFHFAISATGLLL